ncbi:hypothetical protein HDV63DRAFT_77782 [Trichoderma sp. SZMC 28014]
MRRSCTLYPVPWPDIPLFSLFSSARPSLRPTWNANSLDRILCLLFCFSRVVLPLRIIVSVLFSPCCFHIDVVQFFGSSTGLPFFCFSQVFPPFPCVPLFAHAGIGRLFHHPIHSIHIFQPLARIPLGLFLSFCAGPLLEARRWLGLTAALLTGIRRYSFSARHCLRSKTSTSPVLAADASQPVPGHPSESLSLQEWRPKNANSLPSTFNFFFLCPLVAAAPERSDIAFLFSSCFERAGDDILDFRQRARDLHLCAQRFWTSTLQIDLLEHHPPQPPHHRTSGHSAATVAAETPCRPWDSLESVFVFAASEC